MINTLQISGLHSNLTNKERSYALKKIGGLDKYIPKMARASASVEVKLKGKKAKDKRTHECEVIMKLPKSTITSHRNSTSFIAQHRAASRVQRRGCSSRVRQQKGDRSQTHAGAFQS